MSSTVISFINSDRRAESFVVDGTDDKSFQITNLGVILAYPHMQTLIPASRLIGIDHFQDGDKSLGDLMAENTVDKRAIDFNQTIIDGSMAAIKEKSDG